MSAKVLQFPTQLGPDAQALLERAEAARLVTDEEQRARKERLDMGEWPRRLTHSGLEIDDNARVAILLDRCRDEKPLQRVRAWYAKRYPSATEVRPSGPPWIFLCGPRGVGKSTAAGWVLARQWGVAITMSMLLADFTAWKRCRNAAERYDSSFERCKRANVLVLDEVGTERDRDIDTAREAMFALINGRQSKRTNTIVLTNLNKEMMAERIRSGVYDERSYDRLRGMALVMGFDGESLRRTLPGGGL